MINSWPTTRRSGFDSRFASIISCIVTPNFSAMTLSVSPGSTTYFWPLGVGDDGAAADGGALLVGAEGGGPLAGAVEDDAGAEGARLALGVAGRDALGVAALALGVAVAAESRVQAPSSSAQPRKPAATPSRR
jgi:hypothetical protein